MDIPCNHKKTNYIKMKISTKLNDIILFTIISYLISWIIWIPTIVIVPAEYSLPFLLVGSFGPFLAAVFITRKKEGNQDLRHWLKTNFNLKIGIWWYILASIILPLIIAGIHHAIYMIFGGKSGFSWDQSWSIYLINLLLTAVVGGGNEEPGWRGYLTPQLLKKFNPFISCVMVGIIWVGWHLPLYFLDTWSGGDQPIYLFVLYAIPLSVILTWLYFKSKKSIIPVMLLHAATNIVFEYFPRTDVIFKSMSFDFNIFKVISYWIIASVILIISKGKLGYLKKLNN